MHPLLTILAVLVACGCYYDYGGPSTLDVPGGFEKLGIQDYPLEQRLVEHDEDRAARSRCRVARPLSAWRQWKYRPDLGELD